MTLVVDGDDEAVVALLGAGVVEVVAYDEGVEIRDGAGELQRAGAAAGDRDAAAGCGRQGAGADVEGRKLEPAAAVDVAEGDAGERARLADRAGEGSGRAHVRR